MRDLKKLLTKTSLISAAIVFCALVVFSSQHKAVHILASQNHGEQSSNDESFCDKCLLANTLTTAALAAAYFVAALIIFTDVQVCLQEAGYALHRFIFVRRTRGPPVKA